MWLFWSGPITLPLTELCRMYLWRFAIEHFFRFIKQHLGFYATRSAFLDCTERWIDIVILAYWQILLAASEVHGYVAPWRSAPKRNLPFSFAFTPRQVQLALPGFLAVIGTPAPPTGPAGCTAPKMVYTIEQLLRDFFGLLLTRKIDQYRTQRQRYAGKKMGSCLPVLGFSAYLDQCFV